MTESVYHGTSFAHPNRRPTPGGHIANLPSFSSYVETRASEQAAAPRYGSSNFPHHNGWYAETPSSPGPEAFAVQAVSASSAVPVASLPPPGATLPTHQNTPSQIPAPASQTNYFPSRSALKCSVVFCTIFIVLGLTAIGTLALLHRLAPGPRPDAVPHFPADALSQQLQDFSEDLQNVRVFRFPFHTGQSREQRHPEVGGFGNFSTIMSFDVCCESLVKEFVCMGGTTMAHGGPPLEGTLRHDQQSASLYLLLWVNSDDLVEVGCWLTGSYLDIGG